MQELQTCPAGTLENLQWLSWNNNPPVLRLV